MVEHKLELPLEEFAIAVGNENKRLREEIAHLEERLEIKWRPIEDNPPQDRHVIVAIRVADFIHAGIGYYNVDGLCWNSSETDEPLPLTPDYWMDVPPLPKEEE